MQKSDTTSKTRTINHLKENSFFKIMNYKIRNEGVHLPHTQAFVRFLTRRIYKKCLSTRQGVFIIHVDKILSISLKQPQRLCIIYRSIFLLHPY